MGPERLKTLENTKHVAKDGRRLLDKDDFISLVM
jgi:hypothetical protein